MSIRRLNLGKLYLLPKIIKKHSDILKDNFFQTEKDLLKNYVSVFQFFSAYFLKKFRNINPIQDGSGQKGPPTRFSLNFPFFSFNPFAILV